LISRDEEMFAHQVFRFGEPERTDDWYVTPSMTGTRPGAAIAAAWAVMSYLGEDGYLRVVRETLRHVRTFQAGINAIDGLRVMGEPVMTVFAYTSDTLDMFAVADGMQDRGWEVARDTWPVPAIRFMQSLGHGPYFAPYLEDLHVVATQVRDGELVSGGGTANYT
jgi:sphinganine-1-phosphate aldolase